MDDTTELPSGRFVLRLDPRHHAALRRAAEERGISLNAYCALKLRGPGGALPDPAASAVERALEVLGEDLLGVVAFGSWARDEVTASSDVDLLMIVEDRVPIRRAVYHEWDTDPPRWDSHRIEPHFLHLPEPGGDPSGLWAEAAVDGVVLFERDFRVSRTLIEIRREIAAGRIVREECHGHPYWIRAA